MDTSKDPALIAVDTVSSAGILQHLSGADAPPHVQLPNKATCCVPQVIEHLHQTLMQNYASVESDKATLLTLRARARHFGQDCANWLPPISSLDAVVDAVDATPAPCEPPVQGPHDPAEDPVEVHSDVDGVSTLADDSESWQSAGSAEAATAVTTVTLEAPRPCDAADHVAGAFNEDDEDDDEDHLEERRTPELRADAGHGDTHSCDKEECEVSSAAPSEPSESDWPGSPGHTPLSHAPTSRASPGPLTEDEEATLRNCSRRLARYFATRGTLLREANDRLILYAQYHARLENENAAIECYGCGQRLGKRHHCRRCGHQFCATCANYCGRNQDSSSTGATPTICTVYATAIVALDRAADGSRWAEEAWDTDTCPHRRQVTSAEVSPAAQDAAMRALTQHAPLPAEGHTMSTAAVQRLCATCYTNCLAARKSSLISTMRSANRYILGDGLYYFSVLSEEENGATRWLKHPEEAKQMMKHTCQRLLEQAAPQTLVSASQVSQRAVLDGGKGAVRALGSAGQYLVTRVSQQWTAYRQPAPASQSADSLATEVAVPDSPRPLTPSSEAEMSLSPPATPASRGTPVNTPENSADNTTQTTTENTTENEQGVLEDEEQQAYQREDDEDIGVLI